MRHFANFGIVDNIRNSSGKQRIGAGAGLLGLAAAGGYAGYRALKGDNSDGFDFRGVPQNIESTGKSIVGDWTKDALGTPEENLGKGTDIYQNLKGTVEQVYRSSPNTPRDNIYDAIRYPDLRGQQFAETGERLKTVAGNVAKGTISNVGNAGRGLYNSLKPDPYMLQARPEEYLSGKYNLDNLSTQDTLTLYEKMKERGLPDSDRMLSKALKKGFSQQ